MEAAIQDEAAVAVRLPTFPSSPQPVRKLRVKAPHIVVPEAGRFQGAGEVQRECPGLAIAERAPTNDARLRRASVIAEREGRIDSSRARVDDNRAVRQIAVARGRQPADNLDPLDRRRGNSAQVHAAARRCRGTQLPAGARRLEVGVVRQRNPVQDDHRSERGDIGRGWSPDFAPRRCGDGAERNLLDGPQTGR